MSRSGRPGRPGDRSREGSRPAPAPPARRVRATARALLWVAAFAIPAVAIGLLRGHPGSRTSEPGRDGMTAYDQALALARQGLCVESLGGFRRAAAEHPELWFVRHDYAAAILSAVHQGRTRYGLQGPVARSAVEQVAMVREGLGQLDAAEQLARTPRSLAKVRRTRARVMKAWGFAWNAFVGFRESEWADPSWGEIAGLADGYMDLMKEPTRPPTDRREPDEAPPP